MPKQTAPRHLVSDQVWELLDPVISQRPPATHGRTRRPRVEDRVVLEGIVFVLETGIVWKKLPVQLGFGSGVTCWRQLRAWQQAVVWEKLHYAVLDQLAGTGGAAELVTGLPGLRQRPGEKGAS